MTLQELIDGSPYELHGAVQCSRDYWVWEEAVQKALETKGWNDFRWWTSDGDSFGPLVRGVSARLNGEKQTA